MPLWVLDIALRHIGDDRRHQRIAERPRDFSRQHPHPYIVLAQRHLRAVLLGPADRHQDRRLARTDWSRSSGQVRSSRNTLGGGAARATAVATSRKHRNNHPLAIAAYPPGAGKLRPVAYPDPGTQATAVAAAAPRITTSQGGAAHNTSSRKAAIPIAKSAGAEDRARPYRLVERRQQQPDDGGVDAAQGRLHRRAAAQRVPERQEAAISSRKDGRKIATRQIRPPSQPLGAGRHDRAEIGGEGEERPRHRLRRAIAGEKGVVADPAGRHHRGLQQRQHDMAAAEHQRAGAVE